MSSLSLVLNDLEPFDAQLIAVSKMRSPDQIMNLYHLGQRHFGENRVQELISKKDSLPADIQWHLIGHLQSNKVKYIAPFISLIHSVDSLSLAEAINKQATRFERKIPILLQFKVAVEESKFGIDPSEAEVFCSKLLEASLDYIEVLGIMGMASFVSDEERILSDFRALKRLYDHLGAKYFPHSFRHLSMGMSGDYTLALREGSNMVRIGSLLFS